MLPSEISNRRFRAVVETTLRADAAVDARLFASILAPDARFQLGGHPPVVGSSAIEAFVGDFFKGFTSIRHTLVEAFEFSDVLIYEAEVQYHFRDGRVERLPYVNVLRIPQDAVQSYRIYLDLSPLKTP